MRRNRLSSGEGSEEEEEEEPIMVVKVVESSPSSAESSFREMDDVLLQWKTKIWLGEVLHVTFENDASIADLLVDGELLFKLSKVIQKKFMDPKVMIDERTYAGNNERYMAYPKIDSFLKICRFLGLTGVDLFSPSDVVEKRNTRGVCLCIHSLSKKARLKGLNVPDFDFVTNTIAMPKDMVGYIRRNLEQSQINHQSSNPVRRYFHGRRNHRQQSTVDGDGYLQEIEGSQKNFPFRSPVSDRSISSSACYNYMQMQCSHHVADLYWPLDSPQSVNHLRRCSSSGDLSNQLHVSANGHREIKGDTLRNDFKWEEEETHSCLQGTTVISDVGNDSEYKLSWATIPSQSMSSISEDSQSMISDQGFACAEASDVSCISELESVDGESECSNMVRSPVVSGEKISVEYPLAVSDLPAKDYIVEGHTANNSSSCCVISCDLEESSCSPYSKYVDRESEVEIQPIDETDMRKAQDRVHIDDRSMVDDFAESQLLCSDSHILKEGHQNEFETLSLSLDKNVIEMDEQLKYPSSSDKHIAVENPEMKGIAACKQTMAKDKYKQSRTMVVDLDYKSEMHSVEVTDDLKKVDSEMTRLECNPSVLRDSISSTLADSVGVQPIQPLLKASSAVVGSPSSEKEDNRLKSSVDHCLANAHKGIKRLEEVDVEVPRTKEQEKQTNDLRDKQPRRMFLKAFASGIMVVGGLFLVLHFSGRNGSSGSFRAIVKRPQEQEKTMKDSAPRKAEAQKGW